ncbi:hypothetical protein BKA58DRAFT_723 [Alternaria rosae]|uniref:uncharacterized protein n=1 Tax=Alternaria rosae TaxID=1187941 RepID=UPI001E8E0A9A|nr:uncharacterized protein BKA58DRAFT_723 [Alternaria rosae]KAH6881320.1 hypothetical protein BKA58DRAFT_723 [Alternaria rosae]
MAEQIPAGVLWCRQCNKPFTKQSTLKRHGYYCRSNTKASVPRRRSCVACAKSKTACDNIVPGCSRCIQKGLICQYPSKSARQKRDTGRRATSNDLYSPRDSHVNSTVPTVADQTHGLQATTPGSDVPILFDDIPWSLDDMTAFDGYTLPTSQSTFPLVTPSSAASTSPTITSPSPLLLETKDSISHEQNAPTHPRDRNQRQQLLSFSISPAPSLNVRSMIQRPKTHQGAERAASLVFYTLKSYPLMLRQNTLPPFIHPSYVSFTDEGATTEPLENCIALILMMANGVKGSRKFFWRNVRIECERICDQNQSLNKWELLGAMQALSIYILIRLDEGETEHNNLDYLLERAVILVAIQLSRDDFDCYMHDVPCRSKSDNSWQDWVYKESRRRLAVIYRILNKLVFFDPAAMCDMPTEFVIAPLPSKRQLWEARDANEWQIQRQNEPQEEVSFALAVDGEIVKLDQGRLSCQDAWLPCVPLDNEAPPQTHASRSSRSAACWAEWCSGTDSMGGLIMLTASMA